MSTLRNPLLLVLTVCAGIAWAGSDDDAIRQIIQRYMDARNHMDEAALRGLFTEDADQLVSSGQWRHGLENLVKGAMASSKSENGKNTVTLETIRMLGKDAAIADGRYETTSSGAGSPRKMWSSFVLLRTAQGWRIAAIRNMLPSAPQPAPSFEQRAADLVSRMTLEEKVSQTMNDAPAIPRLNIPAYNWWNECLHGVARAGRATVFPEPIGMAASWDQALMFRIATAISDEARAKNNEFLRRGKHNIYEGLTFWTPNINIFRDPRWGRGMETYGEDPYLTGRLAVQFIKGLQGDDPKYLKVVATAKHFAVHSGPESERHTFDARISEADLNETYLPQFRAAIEEGRAGSVMCAYNSLDGQPACANPHLLGDILRKHWGFDGYVVSDCGAIGDIFKTHKFVPTAAEASALAVKAGTDLACGTEYKALLPAVKQGLIQESEIDTALRRLFTARFQLGLFDPPSDVKYAQIPYSVNDSKEHAALALEAARESIVLLKNEGNLLPLSKSLKTVAVIGPNANDIDSLLGNYNGEPSAPVTPLEGIRRKLGAATRVLYARGSDLAANLPNFETIPANALTHDGQPGLKGDYFATSKFAPGEKPLFTRIDGNIDFRWWDGSPRKDLNDDDFGVRWSGQLVPPVSGRYAIGATGMNAFELMLDGKRLARFNNIHERAYEYGSVDLEAGKHYEISLDYREYVGDADIRLVWAPPVAGLEEEAVRAARQADTVILFLGLSPRLEGEEMKVPVDGFQGGDRVSLDIPRVQQALLEKIAALGKPAVLVLLNGSAVSVNWAKDHIPAIVESWYGGQAAGTAIADVLFGDYNPAGRLPVTFYKSADQLPPFTDYSMKGRTYRYFEGEPLWPFGFGLSYTAFTYRNLTVNNSKASAEVTNTGKLPGDEVVQLYAGKDLAGFERIHLKPGETKRVEFAVPATAAKIRIGDLIQ
jgi:beta-glucosidase